MPEETNKEKKEQKPSQDHDCPGCGRPTRTATFRTGSVNHGPKPTNVCDKCGTHT